MFTSSAATAIVSEGELSTRLLAEVERAVRFKRPLGVVGVKLDGSRGARREAALKLASRLRRIDLAGEYATGEYLFVLPETTRAQADALAVTLAELGREVAGVGAAARAAAVPDDGTTADELIGATLGEVGRVTPASADTDVVVAEDGAMRELFELARRAARSEVTVLLTGETGSGKEVIAAEIHRASARAAGPYIRINCASIPETLIESELFGHERGAFTGADKRRVGFIERAHGGTLLLDEIGELPLSMQAKLLRVLEERKVLRVGSVEEIDVDVRFVAATNRDLEREVEKGAFRHDLFFRLSAMTLRVPPLRDRPKDLPLLAAHFAHARDAGGAPSAGALHRRIFAGAVALSVAGQRARAAQRHRARGHPGQRQRADRDRAAGAAGRAGAGDAARSVADARAPRRRGAAGAGRCAARGGRQSHARGAAARHLATRASVQAQEVQPRVAPRAVVNVRGASRATGRSGDQEIGRE